MAEDRTAESTAVSFLEERHKAAYKCIAATRKYLLLSKSIPINLRRPARYFGMVGSFFKKKKCMPLSHGQAMRQGLECNNPICQKRSLLPAQGSRFIMTL